MKGVYAAIVTHFDEELRVDADAVAAEVNRLVGAGVHGIVPNGTVGEGGSLSREERRAVIEIAVGAAAGQASVCAGVSAATAEQAGVYARDARSAGADSVMTLPPLLYRADRRELVEFFGEIGRVAELPLMVYNNPMGSGSDLEPRLLAELVQEVPAITAIKETSGDARRIAELVNLLPLARLDMTPKLVQYFKAALDDIGIGGGPCRPPRLALTDEELEALRAAVSQGALAGRR